MWQDADSLGTTVEVLADKAIRRYLRQEAEKKIRREERRFCSQHAQLLDQYAGQFIAMHEGQVIDSDADDLALYLRVLQRFPLIGINFIMSKMLLFWNQLLLLNQGLLAG